jgi:hypothetical protein
MAGLAPIDDTETQDAFDAILSGKRHLMRPFDLMDVLS